MAITSNLDIATIMKFHAIMCILIGVPLIALPHNFYQIGKGRKQVYNHVAHEYLRMYGACTLAIGWIVWRCREINDGRLHRIICESFAICYLLQAIIMTRAEMFSESGNSGLHVGIITTFASVGLLYFYIRFIKINGIKHFELPGSSRDM